VAPRAVLVPERRKIFETLTVHENLRIAHRSDAGQAREIEPVFEFFPVLAARREQLAGYLSGGERQMLAIGAGAALPPEAAGGR
jgi:branched-chain amino acid transport system ATP-binding protein